jgi:hypothetical protein
MINLEAKVEKQAANHEIVKSQLNLDIQSNPRLMKRGSSMLVMEGISARGAISRRSKGSSSGDEGLPFGVSHKG